MARCENLKIEYNWRGSLLTAIFATGRMLK